MGVLSRTHGNITNHRARYRCDKEEERAMKRKATPM